MCGILFLDPGILSQDLKEVVDGVICQNSFFAHPENILMCMLKDERPHIRELAARRIIKSSESSSSVKSVRVFVPPKLNFEAADYTEMSLQLLLLLDKSSVIYPLPYLVPLWVKRKIQNGTLFTSHVTHRQWNGVSS
ncbi:hypothetical protein AVEN_96052-1 [Araneus ventricosus]|uniref:Uncharacterized protein n=1 Tax=Araneus ventricosus TaxID=182803 RepID=A0A4Y2B3Q4_ARAVE|nr:hypothetical protein AVEN_96052-1 [Araneus ventricosus]